MGNHEFCTRCHQNDFHWGEECNPEHVKKVQDEELEANNRKLTRKERLLEVQKELTIRGFDSKFDEYGYLIISGYLRNE
jgi:ribosomal protein L44E